MAARVRGDERLGQDDDDAPDPGARKVQIENSYFERLKARLASGVASQPVTGSPATGEAEKTEPGPAGLVIYNDDGSIYRKPG